MKFLVLTVSFNVHTRYDDLKNIWQHMRINFRKIISNVKKEIEKIAKTSRQ